MSEEKTKPVFQMKVGSLEVAAWEQEGKEIDGVKQKFLTVSTARNYKDKDGEWKKTNTLRVNDIPAMQLALDKCYEYAKLQHGSKEE